MHAGPKWGCPKAPRTQLGTDMCWPTCFMYSSVVMLINNDYYHNLKSALKHVFRHFTKNIDFIIMNGVQKDIFVFFLVLDDLQNNL